MAGFCQLQFGCQLPNVILARRTETFVCKFVGEKRPQITT